MNAIPLRYLHNIEQELGGPIREAVADGSASRVQYCAQHTLTSLLAEEAERQHTQEQRRALCRSQLPQLRARFCKELDAELLHRLETCASAADAHHDATLAADLAALSAALAKRAGSDDDARALLEALVAIDADHFERVERRWQALTDKSARRVNREIEPLDAGQQQRFLELLRVQCQEGEQLRIREIRALAGGFSKQTIMVTLSGAEKLPQEIVIRRDRAESPVGTSVVDEFELLKTMYAAGVRVPQPFAVDDGSVMGSAILVVARIGGTLIADPYEVYDRSRPQAAYTLARELAKIHRVPYASLKRPPPGPGAPDAASLLAEVRGFYDRWRSLGQASITIEAAFEWLFAHAGSLPDGGVCVTHHDVRFHNILCDESGVTGILDWELSAAGRPARDIGYVYHQIVQFADWDRFLAEYRDAGGEVPSQGEIDFHILWADLMVAVYMYLTRAGYLSSQDDNIQFAYASERMRQHNMQLLSARIARFLRERR